MLAVGYTASFVGSYFYGFQILSRRFVILGLQISLLVIAIYVSALVTSVSDRGTYGIQVSSYGATRALAILATAYMATAVAALVRTLWKNRDPIVRRQALVMLAGIVAHGAVAESYWYLRMTGAGYPPPVLTATALIMAGTFAFAILRHQMFVVTPRGEASTTLPRKFPLKDGRAYLARERRADVAFRALSEMAHRGRKALVDARLVAHGEHGAKPRPADPP
ncbi:MAG: hypothetical protein E6K18_07885 [Methanobacteriota archaeon]|nr:MAG: hypothetical protein E6K18_07885 [Euryarchaeota archaeon]